MRVVHLVHLALSPEREPGVGGPEGVTAREDAKRFANIATVASVLGGLGLAGGVVLYVTAPSGEEQAVARGALIGLRGEL